MSYINDALKKARDGKNSRYEIYGDIIVPPGDGKQPPPGKKRILGWMALLVVTICAGVVWYYYQDHAAAPPVSGVRQAVQPPTSHPLSAPPGQAPRSVRPLPPSGSALKEETLASPPPRPLPRQFAGRDGHPPVLPRAGTSLKEDAQTPPWPPEQRVSGQDVRPPAPPPMKPAAQAETPAPLTQQKPAAQDVRPAPPAAKAPSKEQASLKDKKSSASEAKEKAEKLYQEALALQRSGRLAEAESLYKKTLAIDKKNVQALNNLGVVYMSQDRGAHAVDAFRRAILLKKNYADPYYNLACIQAKWQNIGTALYYLKMAVSINEEVVQWARSDKDLANLRESPEFKSLIEKRGHE